MPHIPEEPPETVQLVDHVLINMQALNNLLNLLSHIMVIPHPGIGTFWFSYGLGDSSGEVRGSQLSPTYLLSHIKIYFWCTEDSEK